MAVSLSNGTTVIIRNPFTNPGGENQTSVEGMLIDVRSFPNNLIELKVLQGNTLKTIVLDDAARTVTQFKEAAPSGFLTPQTDLQVQRVNAVAAIYREILLRTPSSQEVDALGNLPLNFLRTALRSSNERFVVEQYQNLLERAPDPGGRAAWLNALNRGVSRSAVRNAIAAANESFVVKTLYRGLLGRAADPDGLPSGLIS